MISAVLNSHQAGMGDVNRTRYGVSIFFLVLLPMIIGMLLYSSLAWPVDPGFDFFGDQPIPEAALIEVPPEKPLWMSVGGPLALLVFFFLCCWMTKWLIPFRQTGLGFNLHDLPIAAQRGIGIAAVLYGIALCFGGIEAHYQINVHGGARMYFQQMGPGKLIAFTHAHLFGFTTSFFVVGIPFSLHFSRLKTYQWVFPIGLIASLTDVISWWGIKYVSDYFEYMIWFCGTIFTVCYLWMLLGLVRVIFFPNVKWFPDYISEDEQKLWDKEKP